MLNQCNCDNFFYTENAFSGISFSFFFFTGYLTNKREGKIVIDFLILTYTPTTAKLMMSYVFSLLILNKLVWTDINYKLNTNISKLYNSLQFAMAPIQEST